MARTFAITADDKPVALDDKGAGEITITVSNTSARPIRGQARLVPLGTTKAEWLRLGGEVERNFSPNDSQQFVVRMTAPADASQGKYPFRLNVVSVQNPDDDFTEGPSVAFELRTAKPVPPPNGKKFPWFYVILAVVLIAGVVGVVLLLTGGNTTVPPLTDLTLEQVTNELNKAKLTLGSVSWTNAGATVPEHVEYQTPLANTKVKPKSAVTVVVREKAAAAMVPVPSVIGNDPVAAVNALVSAHLAVTNLLQVPTTRTNDWNKVVDQLPKPGGQVVAGTPVTLSIGVRQMFVKPFTVRELMRNPQMLRVQPGKQ
jgi:hypothetical protein